MAIARQIMTFARQTATIESQIVTIARQIVTIRREIVTITRQILTIAWQIVTIERQISSEKAHQLTKLNPDQRAMILNQSILKNLSLCSLVNCSHQEQQQLEHL